MKKEQKNLNKEKKNRESDLSHDNDIDNDDFILTSLKKKERSNKEVVEDKVKKVKEHKQKTDEKKSKTEEKEKNSNNVKLVYKRIKKMESDEESLEEEKSTKKIKMEKEQKELSNERNNHESDSSHDDDIDNDDLILTSPKKKKNRIKEVEEDEAKKVKEQTQISGEKSKTKEKGKNSNNNEVKEEEVAAGKIEEQTQMNEKENETKSLKGTIIMESDEESSVEEKSPKIVEMEEQKQEKINNEKNNRKCDLVQNDDDDDEDDEDDDDDDDDMQLQLDSDGSVDDDSKFGVISRSTNCQLTPEEKLKIGNLFIRLKHKVLPQHKVGKFAGTRGLNEQEKAEFEKYAPLRRGPFLKRENKILRKNWHDFCITHGWNAKNPRPFLQMRQKNKFSYLDFRERLKFIQFLANGLKCRSLYSIFNRFKVLYDPHKVSRYSSREDDIIIDFIRNYENTNNERDRRFAELALILKRTRASVWRRYRVLTRKLNLIDDVIKDDGFDQ